MSKEMKERKTKMKKLIYKNHLNGCLMSHTWDSLYIIYFSDGSINTKKKYVQKGK